MPISMQAAMNSGEACELSTSPSLPNFTNSVIGLRLPEGLGWGMLDMGDPVDTAVAVQHRLNGP